ncbi:anaerobic dimethyl sulfoxide reductase chain A [Escherichia coli]|uniref:Anaerobic dimethyl sulfoxide reductase chain A n=1 Tax=Escherichia coli TaxID=562 RepID=A0A377AX81_ECOLX|nr:anaerobic dimethyl sulfoxide reductase chain A [Escherichia coli]
MVRFILRESDATMMPGVVALGEGAWYDPDAKRVDKGGCINVLTTQRPSPLAKGNPSHTKPCSG